MEGLSDRPWRWQWLLAALFLLAFTSGLIGFLRKGTSELPVYTRAAGRMQRGDPIYVSTESKPFTYPPFFAIPFLPFLWIPQSTHRVVWYLLNVAALIAVLFLLFRALKPHLAVAGGARAPPLWLYFLLVLLLAGRHLTAVFENQSHDLLILLAVMLAVDRSARRRDAAAGLWAGVGAACKATPFLFAPVFLWQRRPLAGTVVLLAAVGLTVLPDLLWPQCDGRPWAVSWYDTFVGKLELGGAPEAAGAWSRWNILNQNLAGTIYRLSTPVPHPGSHRFDVSVWNPDRGVLTWLLRAAQAAVLLLTAWITRPARSKELTEEELAFRRLAEGGVVLCAMVLLSPMSSKSHFCVLVVPLAVCLADFLYRERDPLLGLLLLIVFAAGTLTAKGIVGRSLGNELLARGSVTLCALASLLAAGRVLLQRRRTGSRTSLP